MRSIKSPLPRQSLVAATLPVVRSMGHTGRQMMESLEGRRLLAAPQIADLGFSGPAVVDKTLFIPVVANDADGDAVSLSASVTAPDGAAAAVTFTPDTNRWLEMDVDGYGTLLFQLFDNVAPETTSRIAGLADTGWYDQLRIGRVERVRPAVGIHEVEPQPLADVREPPGHTLEVPKCDVRRLLDPRHGA